MEGASSATQWFAGMGRRSLQTGWELFFLLTLISLSALDGDLCPQLTDHDECLRKGSLLALRLGAQATALPYLGPSLCLCPQGGHCARESLCRRPSSCWRHNDTWWVFSAITRRIQRPLMG